MSNSPLEILRMAATGIEDRAAHRDTSAGEKSMARNVAIFNALAGLSLTETEGWLFLACMKMARAVQGEFHEDDYVDLAGYVALAGASAAVDSPGSGLSFAHAVAWVGSGAKAYRRSWADQLISMTQTEAGLLVVRYCDDPATDSSPSDVDMAAHDWFTRN